MDNETATNAHFDAPMQDITDRLESALYDDSEQNEPDEIDEDVVSEDEEILPEDDDTDAEDEDGLDSDLEDIADDDDGDLSLAEYLGVDEERLIVDDEGNLSFNAIIDGETKTVPLKDLTTSYQLQGHVNNKSIALENDRKEFEEQKNAVATQLSERVQGVSALAKMMEDEVVGDYASVDWDALRVQNPSEWSALRQEFAEKAKKVQDVQKLVLEEQQRLMTERQMEMQTNHQTHIKGELEKVILANPTWADEEVRKADQVKLRNFLESTYSFGKNDMQGVTDSRLISLIQDAQKYREGTKLAEGKKQKKVPKFRKPGAAKANANQLSKARRAKANKKAISDSGGSTNAIAASILDRM
jgi:hypothetical protein